MSGYSHSSNIWLHIFLYMCSTVKFYCDIIMLYIIWISLCYMALYIYFLHDATSPGIFFPSPLLIAGKHMFILLDLLMMSGLYYSQLSPPPIVVNHSLSSTPLCYITFIKYTSYERISYSNVYSLSFVVWNFLESRNNAFFFLLSPDPCRMPKQNCSQTFQSKLREGILFCSL